MTKVIVWIVEGGAADDRADLAVASEVRPLTWTAHIASSSTRRTMPSTPRSSSGRKTWVVRSAWPTTAAPHQPLDDLAERAAGGAGCVVGKHRSRGYALSVATGWLPCGRAQP